MPYKAWLIKFAVLSFLSSFCFFCCVAFGPSPRTLSQVISLHLSGKWRKRRGMTERGAGPAKPLTSWLTFNAAHLKVGGSLAFTLLKARRDLDAMSAQKISIRNVVGNASLKEEIVRYFPLIHAILTTLMSHVCKHQLERKKRLLRLHHDRRSRVDCLALGHM